MRKTFSRVMVWGVCCGMFFAAFPLGAQNFWDGFFWSLEGSILFFPEDNGNAGDPAPILPSFGAAVAMQLTGPLYLELTEDMYFTHYAYDYHLDRAVPAAIENRSAFVFGFLTGLQALGRFPLNENFNLRVYGGPAADFRIINLAGNLHPDDFSGDPDTDAQIQTDSIREYFWNKGRWFMPVFGAGFDYVINEKFLIGLDLRIWFPVYKLDGTEDLPLAEGWRFGLGLRITPRRNIKT